VCSDRIGPEPAYLSKWDDATRPWEWKANGDHEIQDSAGEQRRQPKWTESLAVGRREFVERMRDKLGGRARHRQVEAVGDEVHVLGEGGQPYGGHFGPEIDLLRPERT